MKNEAFVQAVMKHFSISREEALTAPACIFDVLPDALNKQSLSLSDKDIVWAARIAKEWLNHASSKMEQRRIFD